MNTLTPPHSNPLLRSPSGCRLPALLLLTATLAAGGCGGGAEVAPLPQTDPPVVADYNGPAPATSDVQSFKLNVWDNLKGTNRCGACHSTSGQQPTFVRNDDVNMAYADANPLVDLNQPSESLLVSKVGGGHNCWESDDSTCASILTTWIGRWAGDTIGAQPVAIQLEAPQDIDVGASKSFPDDSTLFGSTVYPLLTTYCSGCHSSDAANSQQPYIAEGDVDIAYEATRAKLNLDQPDASRLYDRLVSEFHNCWSDCGANGDDMLIAITSFTDQITVTPVDPALVTSKALTLFDGTLASGGNRNNANVIALYEFKTGNGLTAFDTSGVEPALHLNLSGDVTWVGGYGINVQSGKAQGTTSASAKLHDQITATGEYSIEAWVVPANVVQEEARIVSYSGGTQTRNFMLGQTLYNYDFLNRSSVTDANGEAALTTADADEDLQATLQHVVATYSPVDGRRIYVNGVFTDDRDDAGGGSLADWDDTFALVLGNEVSSDRQWAGVLRLVAIHNRVLTPEQIQQNFDAGVGERFFLLFNVSEQTGLPGAYIVFEVSQFDSYSYLFSEPRFVSLTPNPQIGQIPLLGLRLGVNGQEVSVGQAYARLDTMLSDAAYDPAEGQALSPLGTIIALDKGPQSDQFFLSFERLGAFENVRVAGSPLQPPVAANADPQPAIGMRTFDEINATLATITGVSSQQVDVQETFQTIRQQLPALEDIGTFLSSHQVAVAQLSIEYCNALVDDNALRSAFFPGFDFTADAATTFANAATRDQVFDPLLAGVLGSNVATQPEDSVVRDELIALSGRLTTCGSGCSSDRTEVVVKALCASVLGSAPMLLQ